MDGLVMGIDLCDEYTQIHCFSEEKTWLFPTVICKKKQADEWFVGEDAYAYALMGEGILADRLLKMVLKDGYATMDHIKYRGIELLQIYLKKVMEIPLKEFDTDRINQIVITLPKIEGKFMDSLMYCVDFLGIPRSKIHVISHTESFMYYVLSQKREIWNNQIGMFDLARGRFRYYEMKVQRGLRQTTVIAEYETLEEGFNLDILETPSGSKLADKIVCTCGKRMLQKKIFSSVFLTGKGFEKLDWAPEWKTFICNRRKVFVEPYVFAKGAAYKAVDYTREKTAYPYVFICDGRLETTVSIKVISQQKESQLILASAGDHWYEAKTSVDLIIDNQNEVEFALASSDAKKRKWIKIPLDGFPDRPNRTTRVTVTLGFLDGRTMAIKLEDKGFGELFPATDTIIRQEVMLWA